MNTALMPGAYNTAGAARMGDAVPGLQEGVLPASWATHWTAGFPCPQPLRWQHGPCPQLIRWQHGPRSGPPLTNP